MQTPEPASEVGNLQDAVLGYPESSSAGVSYSEPSSAGVMKVNQLDAGVLDKELHDLLRMQMARMFTLFQPGVMERFKPELDALLHLLLFRFTIGVQKPTPGMRLQSLRYRNEAAASALPTQAPPGFDRPTAAQRRAYGILFVGTQWALARAKRQGMAGGWGEASEDDWRRRAWRLVLRLEVLWKAAWLLNLLLFLGGGMYPTPLDRLLRMRMVYSSQQRGPRAINYQFMNRRLLWDHFTRMALVLLPLVDWDGWRRRIVGAVRRRRADYEDGRVGSSAPGTRRSMECCECGRNPAQTPYETVCGHLFCYYCLKSACVADTAYSCPLCGTTISSSLRWGVDDVPR